MTALLQFLGQLEGTAAISFLGFGDFLALAFNVAAIVALL